MTQRERVIKHLLRFSTGKPTLVKDIQRDLTGTNSGSLSSILTILGKTQYFKRTTVAGEPVFVKIKHAPFPEVINAFRKKDMELYGQFKGKTPPNHRQKIKKAVEPPHQDVIPALKTMVAIDMSGSISDQEFNEFNSEILDAHLGSIVKTLKHHVDEIERIFKEFKELKILRSLVEKFVMKGDKK